MQDNDTLVWRLVDRSEGATECWMRFAPGGVEVEIRGPSINVTHRFTTGTEAMAWAEEAREEFETSG